MRECHLTKSQRGVLLYLFQKFFTQLERCHMTCQIVEVDSSRWLLAKLDAFDPDLIVRFNRSDRLEWLPYLHRSFRFRLKPVDAVILLWFVSLSHNYLLD